MGGASAGSEGTELKDRAGLAGGGASNGTAAVLKDEAAAEAGEAAAAGPGVATGATDGADGAGELTLVDGGPKASANAASTRDTESAPLAPPGAAENPNAASTRDMLLRSWVEAL